MNKNYVLSVIQKYTEERILREHLQYISPVLSYQKWAVDELIKNINKSEYISPVMIIENFIHKMDDFSCKNINTSFIFSIAYDVATDVLDILIAMK